MQTDSFTQFNDEFGVIAADIYEAALALWPRLSPYAHQTLGDSAAGQRLLMKACALVTQRRQELRVSTAEDEPIQNLPGYLLRTWQRLVLAALEKENNQRQLAAQAVANAASTPADHSQLERAILLQQIMRKMDDWTRTVFECLALGYGYEEIGAQLGSNGHAVRMRYERQLKALQQLLRNPAPK